MRHALSGACRSDGKTEIFESDGPAVPLVTQTGRDLEVDVARRPTCKTVCGGGEKCAAGYSWDCGEDGTRPSPDCRSVKQETRIRVVTSAGAQ